MQIDEPAQLPQASKGKLRRGHHRRCRRARFGHPRRQQEPAAIGQLDDKVRNAGVNEMTHNHEALAGTRVMRILDDDFKRLLLGSISCVRRGRCRSMS